MVIEALVHDLRVNPAQMRTRVGVLELARLAVQVRNGLDPNLALLLRPDGKGAFIVISGHRRWLAFMIAFIAIADLARIPQSVEEELELMQATIENICDVQDGYVILDERLYESLQRLMPKTLTIPYRLWDGPPEDEVLLLIKANTGAEEPDLVGQARAYKAAVEVGVSYERLAQVTGQPAGRLQAMVALLDYPAIFQALVNNGLLDLSIVLDLTGLQQIQVKSLAGALQARLQRDRKQLAEGESLRDYTPRIRMATINLTGLPPSVPERGEVEPAKYNFASAVERLWLRAIEEAPRQFYHAVAAHSLEGARLTGLNNILLLLSDIPKLKDRFRFEENAWRDPDPILTDEAMRELVPELNCSTCAFHDLPGERVRDDLPFPCRKGQTGPCINWTPKGGTFSLRTPWNWIMGGKLVKSLKELQEAWQVQWDWEHRPEASSGLLSGSAESVDQQRENIRTYMEEHVEERFNLAHPWATACARCAHHLDKSPVKSDPDAPHCTWAKGKRRLQFRAFVPCDREGREQSEGIVPFCLQYGPDREWAHVVPEADTDPPFDREFLLTLVEELAASVNRSVYSTDCRGALQFLTGRPLKASANHRHTFRDQLKVEARFLSDRQVWTLLQWLLLEWLRIQTGRSHQMVPGEDGSLFDTHVTYFSLVMPDGVMEEEEWPE